jgi:hypothetical protein
VVRRRLHPHGELGAREESVCTRISEKIIRGYNITLPRAAAAEREKPRKQITAQNHVVVMYVVSSKKIWRNGGGGKPKKENQYIP